MQPNLKQLHQSAINNLNQGNIQQAHKALVELVTQKPDQSTLSPVKKKRPLSIKVSHTLLEAAVAALWSISVAQVQNSSSVKVSKPKH